MQARDGCVVPTEPLADLLNGFVASWKRDRPPTGGRFRQKQAAPATSSVDPVGAVEWLAEETRRQDRRGVGVPRGTIQNIVGGGSRYKHTELRVADPLVSAIGRPQALHDGTLPILPNPSASAEARARCCGGSAPTFEPWSLTG